MKLIEMCKRFSMMVSVSAVMIFVFYLSTGFAEPIYFTEPNTFIRVTEIIVGVFAIPFMVYMIFSGLEDSQKQTNVQGEGE